MSDQFPGTDSNELLNRGAERLGTVEPDAPTNGTQPDPARSEDARFATRADDLLQTLDVLQDTGVIMMPALTQAGGKPITFRVKRLSVQELMAADLVPKKALQIAGFMIDQAEKRAVAVRKRWNLPDHVNPSPEQMAADQFTEDEILREAMTYIGGSENDAKTEATAGIYSFLGAVVCGAVMEPRLYFNQDQVTEGEAKGRTGVLVWRIPESDLWHIFNWALKTEARAVASNVEPFPSAVNAPTTLASRQDPAPDAGRSDQV
jgi:hypothetical protein